jgi:hypothetical protein
VEERPENKTLMWVSVGTRLLIDRTYVNQVSRPAIYKSIREIEQILNIDGIPDIADSRIKKGAGCA